jgi:hypothetical protein
MSFANKVKHEQDAQAISSLTGFPVPISSAVIHRLKQLVLERNRAIKSKNKPEAIARAVKGCEYEIDSILFELDCFYQLSWETNSLRISFDRDERASIVI